MDPVKIGDSIAILRKRYGMTQLELAEKLNITDKAVSRWERGLGSPDISLLVKLSIILDIDVETLLEGNVSNEDLGWNGVLILKYPDDILPCDLIYTKRIIYLQLCYFILVGITKILIIGNELKIKSVSALIGKGTQYGLSIEYEINNCQEITLQRVQSSARLQKFNENNGIMLINGFDIIYGKDFTKCLRRIMNNICNPTQIRTFDDVSTAFYFLHRKSFRAKIAEENFNSYYLERGVFCLAVETRNDMLDAGNFMRILESHQKEKYMDIEQVAERRNLKKYAIEK